MLFFGSHISWWLAKLDLVILHVLFVLHSTLYIYVFVCWWLYFACPSIVPTKLLNSKNLEKNYSYRKFTDL